MTTDSPWTVGSVTTRMSIGLPSTLRPTRPSCGSRRSEMSSSHMILMRETTPGTIRPGIFAISSSTPSTRMRTRISRASASKWTSDAPWVTACESSALTSLTIGVSVAASWTSNISTSACESSSTTSVTALSSRVMLAMTARMSSRVATATWTFIPVWISTSSMATTLAGSAMATTSVSSPSRATGTSSHRRATSGGRRLTAAMSSRYCVRSR